MRFRYQRFNRTGTSAAATSLSLAVIGLIIPTIFSLATVRQPSGWPSLAAQNLSVAVAVVLFATYILWLVFSLITHKELFAGEIPVEVKQDEAKRAVWSIPRAVSVLAIAAILIAIMSEFLSGSVETTCKRLGLTEMFVGAIIVATIGNAGESTAVLVALKNNMDLS